MIVVLAIGTVIGLVCGLWQELSEQQRLARMAREQKEKDV